MFDIPLYLNGLLRFFSSDNYGKTLEEYIVSRHPKDSCDIERLTIEWQRNQNKGWLYD